MKNSNLLKLTLGAGCAVLMMTSFSTTAVADPDVGMVVERNPDTVKCAIARPVRNIIFGELTKPEGAGADVETLAICAGAGQNTVGDNPGEPD